MQKVYQVDELAYSRPLTAETVYIKAKENDLQITVIKSESNIGFCFFYD